MTLIACTINFKMPFLIGDLLISSTALRENFIFPANAALVPEEQWKEMTLKPVAFHQKIYVLSENVCVAFAGDFDQIRRLLIELRIRCRVLPNISQDQMFSFLNEYNLEENFFESSLFMMIIERDENSNVTIQTIRYPTSFWSEAESPDYGTVYASGSGKGEFLTQVLSWGKTQLEGEPGDLPRTIRLNMAMITRLITVERISLYTLKKNWGGGFEGLYSNGRTFVKLEKFAIVILEGRFDNNGDIQIPVPKMVLFQQYQNDLLYILSIETIQCEMEEWQDRIIFRITNSYTRSFKVRSIDGIKDENEQSPPFAFSTNRVWLGYGIILSKSIFTPSAFLEISEASVQWEKGKACEIRIPKSSHDWIRNGAKQAYQNGLRDEDNY